MKEEIIHQIVDKHLDKWIALGLNELDGWMPVKSTITDGQIAILEQQVGYRLPDSFKTFLKYKHFEELYISEARFTTNCVNTWQDSILRTVFNGYPREFLYDKGYIPFADWNDWGMLCFDVKTLSRDLDYPIVLWDHERWEDFPLYSSNFYELLLKLDSDPNPDGS